MEFTHKRTVSFVALLLLAAAVTQAIYTGFYIAIDQGAEVEVPRQLLWGLESVIFVFLAAFAGSAMLQAKGQHLGWSAIAFAAVLNVVQVGVGLTMFAPFLEHAGEAEAFQPVAYSIVAFSFMVYNAAKVLLAIAAVVFGMAKLDQGAKALGGLTAVIGGVAIVSNTLSMAMGRDFMGDIPLAGGSGVLATLLLAVCLLTFKRDED